MERSCEIGIDTDCGGLIEQCHKRRQRERTCLTCRFEPVWYRGRENLDEVGVCLWPHRVKIPAHMSVEVHNEVIFKTEPIKNCPAWRPKGE